MELLVETPGREGAMTDPGGLYGKAWTVVAHWLLMMVICYVLATLVLEIFF